MADPVVAEYAKGAEHYDEKWAFYVETTTRETLRAVELGMEAAAVSCVANRAAGLSGGPLSHKEVLEVVSAASGRLARLLEGFTRS